MAKLTTEEFIARVKTVHGDRSMTVPVIDGSFE